MGDMLIKKTTLQELAKAEGCHLSADIYDALNEEVVALVKKGIKRMEGSQRKTLKPIDL